MEKFIRQDKNMKLKYAVIFLLCVLILAASEYYFLLELSSLKRIFILLSTSLAALTAVIVIFISYKHLGRED